MHASYLADVLPAVVVFGLGLTLVVSPLTATVLASADVRHAGLASGVNNAVARAAGLIAVAGLPAAVGLRTADYHHPQLLTGGFRLAITGCAALLVLAALLAVTLVDDRVLSGEPQAPGRTPVIVRPRPVLGSPRGRVLVGDVDGYPPNRLPVQPTSKTTNGSLPLPPTPIVVTRSKLPAPLTWRKVLNPDTLARLTAVAS